ncbi:MAG: acyl-CoA carboxylase subunit beta [Chloroflexi bacterium]|nr:acyl-CoA carboxylase subunit beta [Chloroflexota bacterium]
MTEIEDRLKEIQERRQRLLAAGGPAQIKRQHDRGKLTARERMEALFDTGSFVELDLWAVPKRTGFDIDERELPGDGVITGFGNIDGRPAYAYSQDFTVLGGTMATTHARKVIKVMRRALEMKVPCIGMVDSGGVRIQDAVTRSHYDSYSGMFTLHTVSSGVIPQISLMMGPCAAGASYSPALTDFLFMVRKSSYMYIASPTLVKTVSGAELNDMELGGPEIHARISGCSDLTVESDGECIAKTKEILGYLPLSNLEKPPFVDTGDDPSRRDDALLEIVPTNSRRPYDIREVILHLVDNGKFFELKPEFAPNICVGFARLGGHSVGIVANNPNFKAGAIDIDAADKQARFIRFCDAFNIPLVFLVDNPAYLPGVDQEHGGIIRHGAKVLHAIAEATVPKMTVYVRKAYGGGNPAMCNEPMGSDLLLLWPTAELGLMGPEGAVSIIYRKEIDSSPNPDDTYKKRLEEYSSTFGQFPYHAAQHMWAEDIIDPRDTRSLLIKGLAAFKNKQPERPWKKHSNIPL